MTPPTESRFTQWIDTRIDRFAIGLSALCAVHCVASALFLAILASVGAALLNPLWHEIGLAFAMLFGLVALGRGYARHRALTPLVIGVTGLGLMARALSLPHDGGLETVLTVIGVAVLALGHYLNQRACR